MRLTDSPEEHYRLTEPQKRALRRLGIVAFNLPQMDVIFRDISIF